MPPDESTLEQLRLRARNIEPGVSFAVAYEPPNGVATTLGLDEVTLHHVVACTLARIGVDEPVEVSLLLTDDARLRALNRDYRGIDAPTDVLSFPLLDRPLASAPAEQLWQPPDVDADRRGSVSRPIDRAAPDMATASQVPGITAVQTTDDTGRGATRASPAVVRGDGDELEGDERAADDDEQDSDQFVFIGPEGEPAGLGDIAISRDAVVRQAAAAGHTHAWELAYLLSHGVLHLAGFDDQTESGYRAMVAHQEAALACAGIAR